MESNREQMEFYHTPVLLKESVDGLKIYPAGLYVDVTYGGGGHSREIIERVGTEGMLFAFDQDAEAEKNLIVDRRFTFIRSNFRFLKNFLRLHGVRKIDGLIADLGVSSHHFDNPERGFSFRFKSELDMRMNPNASITASDILNEYSTERLSDIFYEYGELKSARKIALLVEKYRSEKRIERVDDFLSVLEPFARREREKKIIPRAFQALRIEVNNEIDALKEMLTQALELLNPGGRIVVISYHSLEDRMVKNFFKTGNFEGVLKKDLYGNPQTPFEVINRRVIVPGEKELTNNPRSRSAKLRIAERLI